LISHLKVAARAQATLGLILCFLFVACLRMQAQSLPPDVEKVCSIRFDKDTKRPARVEDSALSCLKEAAKRLRENSGVKLVLVGVADPVRDHEADENGHMRETEDPTGLDVRWEDLAAYRSLNAKWYLTRYYGIDPARILPTTDESIQGQEVTFYLVQLDRPISITITSEPRRRMRGLAR
jgi:hypothetical protein